MIKNQISYGDEMMKPTTVHRPWQGVDEMVRALIGGNAIHDANVAQQNAITSAGQDFAEAQREGRNAGVSTDATDSAFSGTAPGDGLPSPQQTAQSYAQAAQARGIDPNVALKVFGRESKFNVAAAGDPDASGHNTSFGVSQLHYGSAGGGANSQKGMGDDFTAATGLDARDPHNWAAVRDFSLDKVAQGGWGPWHAAQRLGVGDWDGINRGDGSAPSGASGGFTHPLAQALAGYKNGIDPELAGRIASSPWSSAEAKAYVSGLLNPQILRDGAGNQYLRTPTGSVPLPGMGPGVLPGGYDAAGVHVPTATTATPGEHPSFTTRPLTPGTQTGAPTGGAPSAGAPGAPGSGGPAGLLPPEVGALADQGAKIGAHADAIKQVGAASGGQYAQDRAASGSYAQRIYPLQQAIPALEKLGTTGTGPGTTQFNEVKSFLQSLGTPGFDASKIQNFDEAKKYLVQYVNQNGGAGTDNQLAAAFSGNPSVEISNAAAVDVAKSALALQRMQQAKVLSADPSRPETYADHARDFSNQQDVRAYGINLMSPEARAKLNASLAPGSPERARFLSSLALAKKTGVLQPLGAQ